MKRSFELQGHRGARGLFPENTLEGFAATLAMGIRSLELDVSVTADDVAVVTHDPILNPDIARGPDGAWLSGPGPAIRSLTFAELRRYDVGRLRPGSRIAGLHPRQQPHDGARIPTLADVFALTAATGARVDAEIKTLPSPSPRRCWPMPFWPPPPPPAPWRAWWFARLTGAGCIMCKRAGLTSNWSG
jgi:glycerophosphoryl diester phosphodiesterase